MRKILIFAFAATLFASCTDNVTENSAFVAVPESITVSFEQPSRVQLGAEGKLVWTAGDRVSVFYKSDANDCWRFDGATGDRVGNLVRETEKTPSSANDKVVVVYPYSDNTVILPSKSALTTDFATVQHYTPDSFDPASSILVSAGTGDNFTLRNVCGWLRFTFSGKGAIRKIELRGNNSERFADKASLDYEKFATSAENGGAEQGGDSDLSGSLSFAEALALDCGEGVALDADAPVSFHLSLLPMTFEKGFTVTLYFADGTTFEQRTDNSVAVLRNTITPFKNIVIGEPEPDPDVEPKVGDVLGLIDGKSVKSQQCLFNSLTVVAVGDNGVVVGDGTGYVYVAMPDMQMPAVGDKVRLQGTLALSDENLAYIFDASDADFSLDVVGRGAAVVLPEPVVIDDMQYTDRWGDVVKGYDAWLSTNMYGSEGGLVGAHYVKIKGNYTVVETVIYGSGGSMTPDKEYHCIKNPNWDIMAASSTPYAAGNVSLLSSKIKGAGVALYGWIVTPYEWLGSTADGGLSGCAMILEHVESVPRVVGLPKMSVDVGRVQIPAEGASGEGEYNCVFLNITNLGNYSVGVKATEPFSATVAPFSGSSGSMATSAKQYLVSVDAPANETGQTISGTLTIYVGDEADPVAVETVEIKQEPLAVGR